MTPYQAMTFAAKLEHNVIRSDEGLTLETSVFQSLYGGQFTFINSVDKPNFRVSLPHRRSTTVSSETNPPFTF